MPWGGSEKQQAACKRKQARKAHSVFSAQRLEWSHQCASEEFPTGVLDRLCLRTDYGAVELDLNWAHPLEMLSFGQGDLIVTLRHWWRNQTKTCRGLHRSIAKYGQVHWEDPLKTSKEQYPDWYKSPAESEEVRANLTEDWRPKQRKREGRNKPTYNRSKSFMGRGSLAVTTPSRSCKVTLWTILVSLLLLTAMITGSPTSDPGMEGLSSPEQESDSLGNVGSHSLESAQEENINLPATWKSNYAENITSEGHSDDELPDDLLFRAERSPQSSIKPKKNKKKRPLNPGNGKGCRLRSLMVKVRDLGLGHDSDEQISFKYCSGICKNSRKNYDVTVSALIKKNLIVPGPQEQISSHPCCRPTKYENVSFLDVNNTWRVVDMLSAIECTCVG
ncbi:artemin [Discoglossus pictus]